MPEDSKNKTKDTTSNKPFYKRVWFWVVVVVLILIVIIASGSDSNNIDKAKDDENNTSSSIEKYLDKPYDENSEEMKIAKTAFDRIQSKFEDTDITKITVNENSGTDNPDDYVLLVNLTWNRKNKEDTTKEMMRMYCDDLAAYTVESNSKVQEVALFWTIPYHKEDGVSAKCSYEQKNGKMILSDKMGLVGDK